MKMTVLEKSECFRALLLLIGKDRKITKEERKYILRLGEILDFNREFSEASIDELLENRYINTEPPRFSSSAIAESVLKDAIGLAFADGHLDAEELKWLHAIAEKNGITVEWVQQEIESYSKNRPAESALLHLLHHI